MARVHINQPSGAEPVENQAVRRAESVPGWATWSEPDTLAWIDENVTDLASAKQALRAMSRMVIALRDAQWPGLGE